jgi:hypothetical protein
MERSTLLKSVLSFLGGCLLYVLQLQLLANFCEYVVPFASHDTILDLQNGEVAKYNFKKFHHQQRKLGIVHMA